MFYIIITIKTIDRGFTWHAYSFIIGLALSINQHIFGKKPKRPNGTNTPSAKQFVPNVVSKKINTASNCSTFPITELTLRSKRYVLSPRTEDSLDTLCQFFASVLRQLEAVSPRRRACCLFRRSRDKILER